MKESDYYKDKITETVNNMDDVKTLKMLYGLINNLLAIDDERVLKIAEKLIIGITKR